MCGSIVYYMRLCNEYKHIFHYCNETLVTYNMQHFIYIRLAISIIFILPNCYTNWYWKIRHHDYVTVRQTKCCTREWAGPSQGTCSVLHCSNNIITQPCICMCNYIPSSVSEVMACCSLHTQDGVLTRFLVWYCSKGYSIVFY